MSLFFTFHCAIETGMCTANSKTHVSKIRQTQQKQSNGTWSFALLLLTRIWISQALCFWQKVKAHISRSSDSMIKESSKIYWIQNQKHGIQSHFLEVVRGLASGRHFPLQSLSLSSIIKRHCSMSFMRCQWESMVRIQEGSRMFYVLRGMPVRINGEDIGKPRKALRHWCCYSWC